jgi:hypothetical protein
MPDEKELVLRAAVEVAKPILPTVYEDVAQPLVKQVGQTLATVGRAVNAAFMPLRGLVWGLEQIEALVFTAVTERLKNVPPERITTPPPIVAGPALEALRFAGPEPSLRDLYVRLLATAMDSTTARQAHPAFVEIIRQLTPDEAKLVALFPLKRPFPVLTIRAENLDGSGGVEVLENFSLLGEEAGCQYPELAPSYLSNVCRLGLAEIPTMSQYTDLTLYGPLEQHPTVVALIALVTEQFPDRKPSLQRQRLSITPLGKLFCKACITD